LDYWLWTDNTPDDFEDYAILMFRYKTDAEKEKDEDEPLLDMAIVTKIIYISNQDLRFGVGYSDSIYEDAITSDPQKILKFLFAKEFY